jgi:hypothetical protein
VQIRGTGKPARVSVSGIAGGGAISVDLDLPANGRALVRDVRVETARAHASLLRLPLRIEPVGGGEPGIGEPAPDVAATPDAGHPSPSTPPSAPPAGTAAPPGAAPVFAAQASQGFKVLMLGRGAEFGTWNQVFYADKTQGEFAVSTYSDTKYLEFFQQFGAIGLASLLFLAIAPLWPAVRVWTSARGSLDRAHIVGLTLIMFVAFASLLHLPSIFKVGFGTVVFMAMAIIAQLGAEQRDA